MFVLDIITSEKHNITETGMKETRQSNVHIIILLIGLFTVCITYIQINNFQRRYFLLRKLKHYY